MWNRKDIMLLLGMVMALVISIAGITFSAFQSARISNLERQLQESTRVGPRLSE